MGVFTRDNTKLAVDLGTLGFQHAAEDGGMVIALESWKAGLDTAEMFAETERVFNEQLNRLEESLHRADPTLADSLKRSREKVIYQIEHLRTRFIHASARLPPGRTRLRHPDAQ